MADAKCVTCEKPVDQAGLCTNCWEVERRLDEYLKSEKGRAFVMEALGSTGPDTNGDRQHFARKTT